MLGKWFGKNKDKDSAEDATAQAQSWIQQGNQLEDSGNLAAALSLYRRAADAAPLLPAAHLNLGIALMAQGELDAAESAYQAGLAIDAAHPFLLYNHAVLAQQRGNWVKTRQLAERAIRYKPDFGLAYVVLSNALDELDEPEAALARLDQAAQIQPPHAPTLTNRAQILAKLERWEEAEDTARAALARDPDHGLAVQALAQALWRLGFTQESIPIQQRAIALLPERRDLVSRHLFALNFIETTSAASLYEAHRAFGARLEAANPPVHAGTHRGSLAPDRKLTVGLLSGDLNAHPVALFLIPLLQHADRDKLTFHAFSLGSKSDHVTKTLRGLVDHWEDLAKADELEIARAIHADGVDILLDLSGHTGDARLGVLASQPAPVQIGWIGYLNTTGLTRVHYRLCDARTDPLPTQQHHTERLLHLPHSQWCYRPDVEVETVAQPPCVGNGFITFGSFNSAGKITSHMLERWAAVLTALPTARLLIADVRNARRQAALQAAFEAHGIEAGRVTYLPRTGIQEYFATYNRVDIALDTYPYGGGTTTFDALWMATPVVTAVGELPASRSAASLLQALALDEWVAPSIDAYVQLAIARARDTEALIRLRTELRQRLAASPLMDAPRFARDFEACLRTAWREHCAQSPAAPVSPVPGVAPSDDVLRAIR